MESEDNMIEDESFDEQEFLDFLEGGFEDEDSDEEDSEDEDFDEEDSDADACRKVTIPENFILKIPSGQPRIYRSDIEKYTPVSNIIKIEISNSVTEIGHYAFEGCTGLKEIHCRIEHLSKVNIESNIFKDIDKSQITVYVPIGKEDEYRHHPEFQGFKEIVPIKG